MGRGMFYVDTRNVNSIFHTLDCSGSKCFIHLTAIIVLFLMIFYFTLYTLPILKVGLVFYGNDLQTGRIG